MTHDREEELERIAPAGTQRGRAIVAEHPLPADVRDRMAVLTTPYEAAVREAVDALPPLTEEARDRLTLLFRGARPAEEFLTTAEVARMLRTADSPVRWSRHIGYGPQGIIKVGRRVLYRPAAVAEFVARLEAEQG